LCAFMFQCHSEFSVSNHSFVFIFPTGSPMTFDKAPWFIEATQEVKEYQVRRVAAENAASDKEFSGIKELLMKEMGESWGLCSWENAATVPT
jgi:hypothetical protein